MESKRLIEILELTKEKLINKKRFQYGICAELGELLYDDKIISNDEKNYVKDFLYSNKPTFENDYKEFRESNYWLGSVYWWNSITFRPQTRQIRIDYLTKLIANVK